jgi:hypothetical protein
MSLTETVGAAGLSIYAEAALVLFFAAFIAVAVRLTRKQTQGDLLEQSVLPFDGSEDEPFRLTAQGARRQSRDAHENPGRSSDGCTGEGTFARSPDRAGEGSDSPQNGRVFDRAEATFNGQ